MDFRGLDWWRFCGWAGWWDWVFPESGLGETEGKGLGGFATEKKGRVGRIEDGEEMEDEGGESWRLDLRRGNRVVIDRQTNDY